MTAEIVTGKVVDMLLVMLGGLLDIDVEEQFRPKQAEAIICNLVPGPNFVDRYFELWRQVHNVKPLP